MSWHDILHKEKWHEKSRYGKDGGHTYKFPKRDDGELDWDNVEVEKNPDIVYDKELDRKHKARKHLKKDVKNILRELEEFQGLGLDEMDLAGEMEDLSKALGEVSVLLQEWI